VLGRTLAAPPSSGGGAPHAEAVVWAAVLALATYRAPFLPQEYASIGPLWVLGLLAARGPLSARRLAIFAGSWLLVQAYAPWIPAPSPAVASLIAAVAQLTAAAVLITAVRASLNIPSGLARPATAATSI
jgi:hypothetical protein